VSMSLGAVSSSTAANCKGGYSIPRGTEAKPDTKILRMEATLSNDLSVSIATHFLPGLDGVPRYQIC
jgi:hypothetical protein